MDQYPTPLDRTVLDEVGGLCMDQIIERVAGLGIGQLLARSSPRRPQ
ncbi:hypothetical protein [Nocardia lijiangensis]